MTESLGLEPGVVRLVPYDATWPDRFRTEVDRITSMCAQLPIRFEHMGSTAVTGLSAKPILDMVAGYPVGAMAAAYVEVLVRAGYVHRGEQGIPSREFFRRGNPRAYHVHLAVLDGPFWREHLAFRDYLRTHGTVRDDYARLKESLAIRFPHDRESYISGKEAFVRDIVARSLGSTREGSPHEVSAPEQATP